MKCTIFFIDNDIKKGVHDLTHEDLSSAVQKK